ncbi:MAG TPA: spore coat associated protein CotJA [Clostridiales bacterium]|nr:spore coat associated protein CotJA [Clostridiales bacterium]
MYDYRCDNTPDDFDKFPLGMAYVPWQKFKNLYSNEYEAMKHGTIFKDLNLPWIGRGC